MAKTQGKESQKWLSDVRRDDEKIHKLLDNYWAAMGGTRPSLIRSRKRALLAKRGFKTGPERVGFNVAPSPRNVVQVHRSSAWDTIRPK